MLPASAGMIPLGMQAGPEPLCAPRIRGDDPETMYIWDGKGWVLPASAGMILLLTGQGVYPRRAPRIRGDDPAPKSWIKPGCPCSPHPRG